MIDAMDLNDFRQGVAIVRLLYGGPERLPVDAEREDDGWTPLCVAANRGLCTIGWEVIISFRFALAVQTIQFK